MHGLLGYPLSNLIPNPTLIITSSDTTIILVTQPHILASPPLTSFFIFFPSKSVHISFENIHYQYYSDPNPLHFWLVSRISLPIKQKQKQIETPREKQKI